MLEQDIKDDIVTLRIDHGKANAADLELLQALSARFAELQDARAVILTGTGGMFSAGVDLKRIVDGGAAYAQQFVPLLDRTLREMFAFPAPLVTAVNGHALAGGCMFALEGDYRLMARGKGRIGAVELSVSVPFPIAPLELLRFALPPQVVQKHVYFAESPLADDALAQGFVDEVTEPDQLLPQAEKAARRLAAIPRAHFESAKRMLRQESLERMVRGDKELNPAIFELWGETATLDGVRAYMQKLAG